MDTEKLKLSVKLFAAVADDKKDFVAVLRKFYGARRDLETIKILKTQ
ncbi:DUF1810 family protein [Mycolicibacterium arenosum]|uniref:DUF1810 family protein n=1 Tax=Mycolicibacterium arenosum TaxID=2952157 RepID=A0ABT1M8C3_9MYCO|nr:DUF1810 family protein [Mycolicibacterium sp. CAU 1645]MCP9274047.1 DUF1810 family protein [Mycolicibacterium sp. CAU 1645]